MLSPQHATVPQLWSAAEWSPPADTLVTRAKDALHLVSSVAVDGLLAPAVEAGLIDLDDQTDVPPLAFGDDEEEPF